MQAHTVESRSPEVGLVLFTEARGDEKSLHNSALRKYHAWSTDSLRNRSSLECSVCEHARRERVFRQRARGGATRRGGHRSTRRCRWRGSHGRSERSHPGGWTRRSAPRRSRRQPFGRQKSAALGIKVKKEEGSGAASPPERGLKAASAAGSGAKAVKALSQKKEAGRPRRLLRRQQKRRARAALASKAAIALKVAAAAARARRAQWRWWEEERLWGKGKAGGLQAAKEAAAEGGRRSARRRHLPRALERRASGSLRRGA